MNVLKNQFLYALNEMQTLDRRKHASALKTQKSKQGYNCGL